MFETLNVHFSPFALKKNLHVSLILIYSWIIHVYKVHFYWHTVQVYYTCNTERTTCKCIHKENKRSEIWIVIRLSLVSNNSFTYMYMYTKLWDYDRGSNSDFLKSQSWLTCVNDPYWTCRTHSDKEEWSNQLAVWMIQQYFHYPDRRRLTILHHLGTHPDTIQAILFDGGPGPSHAHQQKFTCAQWSTLLSILVCAVSDVQVAV